MKIIIHRGTHQIGGSCLEVATQSTRLIVDVGLPLDDLAAPANIPQSERTDETVSEVFARSPEVAAVLISHAHADHTGLLHLVPPGVPIFLSKGTSKMMLAGSVYANQPNVPRERQQVLELRSPHRIGDITVTAFPVDHSAFDAQAFLLEADGQRVLYSGDLRLHGRKPGMARTLIEALRDRSVDALIMEGTHFSEDRQPGLTEMQLEDVIFKDIHSAPGLVLTAFSPMHVDRLVTFYKAARRAGRIFVVDHYAAFIFFLAATQARIPEPKRGAGIQVFLPSRRKRVGKLEALHTANLVYLDDILARPSRYVMPFRTSMLEGDFAAGLPPAARCIYSYWHGYLKKPDWQQAQAAFGTCGGEFLVRHTSGHIHAADIVKFVEAVSPRHVVPIHTTRPEEFRRYFPNALLLNDGEPSELRNTLAQTPPQMNPTNQTIAVDKESSSKDRRLFQLEDGSWLQTEQEGSQIETQSFSAPFTTKSYQYRDSELDALLIGAEEVDLARGHGYRQAAKRPEARPAKPLIPQAEAVPGILRCLTGQAETLAPGVPLGARVVPRTVLRRFYEFLRFLRSEAHITLARHVAGIRGSGSPLEKLFDASVRRYRWYQNREAFCRDGSRQWRQARPKLTGLKKPREAVELITRLGKSKVEQPGFVWGVDDASGLDFEAVSYEISPRRTTGSRYENGASAKDTGSGGMDLLLRSAAGNLPIIGEVKAPNDGNLFAALVQALTYASELVTAHQFCRLRRAHREFADLDSDQSPRCDIYIVYFAAGTPSLRDEATGIADLLMEHTDGAVARHVRRIAFVEATPTDAYELRFKRYHLSSSEPRAD